MTPPGTFSSYVSPASPLFRARRKFSSFSAAAVSFISGEEEGKNQGSTNSVSSSAHCAALKRSRTACATGGCVSKVLIGAWNAPFLLLLNFLKYLLLSPLPLAAGLRWWLLVRRQNTDHLFFPFFGRGEDFLLAFGMNEARTERRRRRRGKTAAENGQEFSFPSWNTAMCQHRQYLPLIFVNITRKV